MYDTTKPYRREIEKLIEETWVTPYVTVARGGLVSKHFAYPEYHHSDGIGTKGWYHWMHKDWALSFAVIDALAMNLNDLACENARPYAVIDHLFLPKDDHGAAIEVVRHLTDLCKEMDIAVTGGETAIHNNMRGMELSITMLGFVEKPRCNRMPIGMVLMGLKSGGLHSNGFTHIRRLLGEDDTRRELVAPTRIYLDELLNLQRQVPLCAVVNITGGAFTKLRGLLKQDCDVVIYQLPRPQPIFQELYRRGMTDEEMYKTFNCGVGMVICARPQDVEKCLEKLEKSGATVIGEVVSGTGRVRISSQFSSEEVIY